MQPLVIRVPQFYWTSIYILHGNYFSTGGNTPQFPEFPSLSLGNVVYLLHGEIPTMETGMQFPYSPNIFSNYDA